MAGPPADRLDRGEHYLLDPQIDIAWLRQRAGVDAEIMAMLMNYNTFDDLGTGQLGG